MNETCWQGKLETFQSSLLIPSTQVNTTQHKNNVRWLSDCLKFSFDIWRENMINSELELTYRKLFHPLHLGTHHNPNLSKQRIQSSFWTTLMQPQDTETGSSSISFSRGYTKQHSLLPETLASTLPPSEGSLWPRILRGQVGPASYPMEKFTNQLGSPQPARIEI